MLHRGCRVGAGAEIRGAILAAGVEVGDGATIEPGAVIGEGARIAAGAAVERDGSDPAGRGARLSDALAELQALDSGDMVAATLALPDHLRDALWRVESARLEPFESSGLVVCGMGGSAIGGDLAAAALGPRLGKPLTVVRGYELPVWTPHDRAVLCSSYSGDTEETVACYEAAEALGAPRIVATTGGELAEAARRDGVPVDRPARRPAAARRRRLHVHGRRRGRVAVRRAPTRSGPRSTARPPTSSSAATRSTSAPRRSPSELEGPIPAIYGADLTAPVAYRWKTQINENAKLPAFSHELPEADHNEIAGWEGARRAGR